MATSGIYTMVTRGILHVYEKIFFFLDYASFIVFAKVSKDWNKIITFYTSSDIKQINKIRVENMN